MKTFLWNLAVAGLLLVGCDGEPRPEREPTPDVSNDRDARDVGREVGRESRELGRKAKELGKDVAEETKEFGQGVKEGFTEKEPKTETEPEQ